MKLSGRNFLGISLSGEGAELLNAVDPTTGLPLEDGFFVATDGEIDRSVKLAAQFSRENVAIERRESFLRRIAVNLEELGDSWLEMAHRETGLPLERLVNERARTVNQLRLFAELVHEGSWVDARIDLADPDRKPLPKPDFRRMLTPIGPVAVFGASNFPFAYSVVGGDTVAAFAAGCPVIVKAHPAHPGTSEMAAVAVVSAAETTGMPEGIFSMLHGGNRVGVTLVRHPLLAAAGFTGSPAGGRALLLAASSRAHPILVHAEMGSVNPVFLLPHALESRWRAMAEELSQSVTLGAGQYCTNPGLIVAIASTALDGLRERLAQAISSVPPTPMLTSGIRDAYYSGTQKWQDSGSVAVVAPQPLHTEGTQVCGGLFETPACTFIEHQHLADEVFGPVSQIIRCSDADEMMQVAASIPGQLTASVHCEIDELTEYSDLVNLLSRSVGRLIFNGYPTSVEVTPAMNHTGPYPACSDSRFTSVGTASIYRFARPLCWQNAPQEQLPPQLKNSNPLHIRRMVDGVWTVEVVGDGKSSAYSLQAQ